MAEIQFEELNEFVSYIKTNNTIMILTEHNFKNKCYEPIFSLLLSSHIDKFLFPLILVLLTTLRTTNSYFGRESLPC